MKDGIYMNKKIIILVLIVMMLPFNVNATLCGNEDRARFVDMAKNINFSYQYTEDDDVHFTIKVSNIPENFMNVEAIANLLKKNQFLDSVEEYADGAFKRPARYRTKNLPAAGSTLAQEDRGEQLSF